MAATSLWELRKRPLPRGVVSLLGASPAPPSSRRKRSPSGKIRQEMKANCKASRGLTPAFDAADCCLYRGGGTCFAPRTFKDCGARHTLCAMHRDRTNANQRRYDEKKRLKKIEDVEAEAVRRKEKRDRDRTRRAAKAKTEASLENAARPLSEATLSKHKSGNHEEENVLMSCEHIHEEADSSRAWLRPFQPTKDAAGLAAWREDAVEQFLREEGRA